jgi:DNA topoisomerase-1
MRTDSTRVAESAATTAREYLRTLFGKEFLADKIQLYGDGKAKNTQDAHESVRPTDPTRRPDDIRRYLTPDQYKLYQLIWQRFMGSQMAPAVFDTTTVDFDIAAKEQPDIGRRSYLFRSTGSIIKFQGFLALYRETREEGDSKALEDENELPVVEVGEDVPVHSITPSQHFTEPPPRFSEASLVKELDASVSVRPSTYASIISVLADRRYVNLEQRRFFPTELGETVEKVMVKQFPEIFNVDFTSGMELELDKVEEGELGWRAVLADFWGPFDKSLKNVQFGALIAVAHDLSALVNERCPDCGGHLEPRGGFFGPFLACENHPKTCKYTRPLKGEKAKPKMTDIPCHLCGAADGRPSGTQRRVPRLQHLPEVPRHALHADGRLLSQGRRRAGGAPLEEARHGVLRVLERDVRLRRVEQAGRRDLSRVRLRRRGDEVHEDARRLPEVPQVRQRVGRALGARAAGGGAGAGGMRRAVSWLVRIGGS